MVDGGECDVVSGRKLMDFHWDRGVQATFFVLPYLLLALSTLFSLLETENGRSDPWVSLGLAALALCWLLGMFTLPPPSWRGNPVAMGMYFAGFILLSAVMVLHNPLFFLFALVGFFHAFLMRPIALAVLGVAATSIIINTFPGGFKDPFGNDFLAVLIIFLLQTVAVSGATIAGMKMAEQSEQRRKMVAQLEATLEENAGLHAQLVTQAREAGVHDERQRMAREIHDTLAQGLTGIITQLQAAKRVRDCPGEWERHIDTAAELARESLSEARRSVHAVRPEALESSRLGDAVSEVARRWSEINAVPVEVATTGTARPMHPEVEVALLRTTQEALANVTKHARASRVGLTLSYMEDLVRLDVRDDGVGFVTAAGPRNGSSNGGVPQGGFGLTAMRQRVSRLAGRLEIESEPGGGTAISASVPAIQPGGTQ